MNNESQTTKKPELKICADIQIEKVAPVQQKPVQPAQPAVKCVGNVCSLGDWKPRKKSTAA